MKKLEPGMQQKDGTDDDSERASLRRKNTSALQEDSVFKSRSSKDGKNHQLSDQKPPQSISNLNKELLDQNRDKANSFKLHHDVKVMKADTVASKEYKNLSLNRHVTFDSYES